MDNRQLGLSCGAYRMPALFAIDNPNFSKHYIGIAEDERCATECNTVFGQVRSILFGVPFESHRYTDCITLRARSPHTYRRAPKMAAEDGER
jgi:hypothetical protein